MARKRVFLVTVEEVDVDTSRPDQAEPRDHWFVTRQDREAARRAAAAAEKPAADEVPVDDKS